jgi:aspartyl-tRNA(Asn)/glutamyl-tRNA(Gln) amidotransferase subunit C
MRLNAEKIKHIASLARLSLSDNDVEDYCTQLSEVLENFEILNQVETSNVEPATQSVNLQNVFRNDRVRKSYSQNEVLANAPRQENNCFKVKVIL